MIHSNDLPSGATRRERAVPTRDVDVVNAIWIRCNGELKWMGGSTEAAYFDLSQAIGDGRQLRWRRHSR
jgi:hypothetical protein